ncbi:hypothetical protein ESA94_15950 [Lacibacter luteus]|uniref:Uncharacterized protein n=1 Tax=Lacibacter luteus TaxID=2508719 RepID=A0A4Q1CGH3_9BACT|nr:hypothetical protein [Lacibacter luteus]RXK58880.1 hypothetical protein ESA94_15950 [Lacibacter luteus]
MKQFFFLSFLLCTLYCNAQIPVTTTGFNKKNGATVTVEKNNLFSVKWPAGNNEYGRIIINLDKQTALFKSIQLIKGSTVHELVQEADPLFWLTIGKRDLVSQNGWNIFFDKVHQKPYQSYKVNLQKTEADVRSEGSRTVIRISELQAQDFKGVLEITLYNGSAMFNVAAVLATPNDSTAIVYDAGLISKQQNWKTISHADVHDQLQTQTAQLNDTVKNQAVKYRTIIGNSSNGSIAVFPAPHQYFYPLDEAFNLKFTWYGAQFKNAFDGYGIGIRQDLNGDRRFVPWFNAPPNTTQRLNFFCQLSASNANDVLTQVKKLTHNDKYVALPGYKTMSSHFHNEFVVNVMIANKPMPDTPSFVKVFKATGIDMVHLAEFHYTAHPKGPDELRLLELKYLFDMCKKYSDKDFLLMPGEEPNEFFGGHWLQIFPKPVYWIMSRKKDAPMISQHPVYGKVYNIANANEMQQLLEQERGLAWTAHARTKGSTGYPDKYKTESFFTSDRFLGAAWKAMPADLSQQKLGNGRILDLMDDMNNWGHQKKVIGEADLFTIEPENEMYAHLNVNYLQMDKLPSYSEGWQPVLDALETGKFFTTTGEVLIPSFTVNNQSVGKPATLINAAKTTVSFNVNWTFPLQFAELIYGDGKTTYRHKIDLSKTVAFGEQTITQTIDLSNKKWIRLEVWDAAANGAFTQTIWLQ